MAWIAAVAALVLFSTPASAAILFASSKCYVETDVCIPAVDVAPGKPGVVTIVIERAFEPESLQGARFGITGLPEDWSVGLVANPALVVVGDPMHGRAEVHFLACQSLQPGESITVLQLTLFATSSVERHWMYIESGLVDIPSSPALLSCDADPVEFPTWGGALVLNPYPLAVEGRSWSAIKTLYRE